MENLLPVYFNYNIAKLESVLISLEIDAYAMDELLSIDFENYLFAAKIIFAVLSEEEASVCWIMREVSECIEEITDDFYKCTVDDLQLLVFNANTYSFFFVKEKFVSEAEELLNSLI